MNEYWRKRQALFDSRTSVNIEELEKQYVRAYVSIRNELEKLYIEITDTNSEVTSNQLYSYNRYYNLLNNINKRLVELGSQEIDINNKNFSLLYEDVFTAISQEEGFIGTIDPIRLNTALKFIWCGDKKHWSERIWGDISNLETELRNTISQNIISGKSYAQAIKSLQERFNVSLSNAERIVRTESSVILNRASLDTYKSMGAKYYKVLSNQAIDSCLAENNKLIPIDKAIIGENCPPFHPNCRCTVVADIKGMI